MSSSLASAAAAEPAAAEEQAEVVEDDTDDEVILGERDGTLDRYDVRDFSKPVVWQEFQYKLPPADEPLRPMRMCFKPVAQVWQRGS